MRPFTKIALLTALVACGCAPKTDKPSLAAWPQGVKYEIFVQSFADGNGDGIGDFKGLTGKLDYLQELGVGAVWLMPIMPSPSYHKYDVTDYVNVHPDYGTLEDFKHMVDEAHKHNIKIVIDFIINHTGSDHPWFQEARKGPDNPYRDYYIWAKKDSIRNQLAKKTITLDSDNITQWHAVDGDTTKEHFYGFFYSGMPDLNFDNPRVREEVYKAGKFWLTEMNVDGFRLDAARHIYPDVRAADNHAFWIEFRNKMQEAKPDVYLVGEVWADSKTVAPYLKGLPALFNFDLGYAITQVANAGLDTINLVGRYKDITDYYTSITTDYLDATFLKNHDQNRILSELGGNKQKARMAAAILLTWPGTPYLYYGEEIGMLGTKPDEYIREPFLWSEGNDTTQTSWETPRYSTTQTVQPLTAQRDDPGSMYAWYKQLIHFRNGSKALTMGTIDKTPLGNTQVLSFIRKYEDEELLVLHNLSDVEITIEVPASLQGFNEVVFQTTATKVENNTVTIPAYTTAMLTK